MLVEEVDRAAERLGGLGFRERQTPRARGVFGLRERLGDEGGGARRDPQLAQHSAPMTSS